jgi:hypothetical protein
VGFASAVALLAAGETNLQHVTRADHAGHVRDGGAAATSRVGIRPGCRATGWPPLGDCRTPRPAGTGRWPTSRVVIVDFPHRAARISAVQGTRRAATPGRWSEGDST